ncbi:MAG: SIS domain-containing protein [Terriglobales bacterium]
MADERDTVEAHFRRSCETLDRAAQDARLRNAIYTIAEAITQAFRKGGKLLIAGNGGSAADAQHIAGEFLSRLNFDRNPLPAIAPYTSDTSKEASGHSPRAPCGADGVLGTGTPLPSHRSGSIVGDERLLVCDSDHWAFVMKRDRLGHRSIPTTNLPAS